MERTGLGRGARGVCLGGVLLLAAGCAGPPSAPPEDAGLPRQATTDVVFAGFESITQKYLRPVSARALAVEGLRGLGAIDPALAAAERGGAVVVSRHDGEVVRLTAPADDDARGWTALVADALMWARRASPEMAAAPAEKIYEAVFDGALSHLDLFSHYAGAEEARRNRDRRDGFDGVGLSFRIADGVVRVTSVVPGTPAAQVGLHKGDRILRIGDSRVESLSSDEIARLLRGPARSRVEVIVLRDGTDELMTFQIERTHIVPPTVAERLEDGVLVLTVSGFNQDTTHSLSARIGEARDEYGRPLVGVVLDLRGNPGGLLRQSIAVADLFLAQGRIVSTRGRHRDSLQTYDASGRDVAHGLPMVVLVDGRSASAAEVVAAALQDRGRAVVVGTTSYGKGTVQTVIRLPNDGEITLTWSRLVTPSGYVLNGLGVLPSVCTHGLDPDGDGTRAISSATAASERTTTALAAWRRAGADEARPRDELRRTCPPERRTGNAEIAVARRLLADRPLFARVLHLAADLAEAP